MSSLIMLASDKAPNRTEKIFLFKNGEYWKIHWKHTTNGKLSNNVIYMQLLHTTFCDDLIVSVTYLMKT